MNDKERLQSCFGPLVTRLFEIDHSLVEIGDEHKKRYINEVIKEIFNCDPESAQDQLNNVVTEIDDSIQEMDNIVNSIISALPISQTINPFQPITLSIQEETKIALELRESDKILQDKIKKDKIEELDYYKEQLAIINLSLVKKVIAENQKSKSKKIFKLTLDLRVEAVGSLFHSMIHEGLIIFKSKDKDNDEEVKNRQIMNFILANFSSKKAETFDYKHLENHFKKNEHDVEVINALKKILAYLEK
jgi:hypothetical protein